MISYWSWVINKNLLHLHWATGYWRWKASLSWAPLDQPWWSDGGPTPGEPSPLCGEGFPSIELRDSRWYMVVLDVAKGSCICVSGFMFVKFWYLLGKQLLLQIPSTFWVYPLHPTSHFGGQEMQAVPTNMSAMSTIRMLRTNTAGDNAQPPLPPEPCIGHWGRLDGVKAWKVWIEACLRWLFSTIIYNEVTTNRFLVFARLEPI